MSRKIALILAAYVALTLATAHAEPGKPRNCNPEKSKPCGLSCIRKEYTCRINGETPAPKAAKSK